MQVFCKNLNNLQSRFFDRLMPIANVTGGAVYTMPQDIVTNHLVIRGSFQVGAVRAKGMPLLLWQANADFRLFVFLAWPRS